MVDYTKFREIQYIPQEPPEEYQWKWLHDELQRLSRVVAVLAAGYLPPTHVAPSNPRAGDIRYADGSDWNPGSGEGIYFFNISSAWVKL